MAKSTAQRRQDLEAAKKQFVRKPKAVLSLDDLAILYGLTKPAFVNLRKTVDGFPDPCEQRGNAFFYPAYKAVCALLAYVTRHETAKESHAKRFSSLVAPPVDGDTGNAAPLTASEQLKAWELRDRLLQEAVAQGHLHRNEDCAAVADKVFSLISRTFAAPSDSLDPNGLWPADIRAEIDKAGEALVLQTYNQMRDMLSPDANQRHSGSSAPGSARGGARKARKSR